ncbi:MAG: hypothetical protein JXD18_13500 [Anaerolineae bacterium]|nr:hypothetical protein [Anaerolineae bacterium]
MDLFTYVLNGLLVETGDIICTSNEEGEILPGQFWRLLGRLVPGPVDHVAVYVGPGGRCVEVGGRGVVIFEVEGGTWRAERMVKQRAMLADRFYGVAYPLQGRGLSRAEEAVIRVGVAGYCLAQVGKPYNLNFLDSDTEAAFYCSQLPYKAYIRHGIDLNTGQGVPNLPGTAKIVFPQEIWSGCAHVLYCPDGASCQPR